MKIKCEKCGEEIEINPASLMAKERHKKNKPNKEYFAKIGKIGAKKRWKIK